MAQTVEIGTILIKEGIHLPEGLPLESAPYVKGWRLVKNSSSSEIDRKLCEVGWTFFFMAGEIKTTVFGFDKQKMRGAALEQLIKSVKLQKCNSIEITQVKDNSFLKVPYVSVSAHPRHLQKGLVFDQAFYNTI